MLGGTLIGVHRHHTASGRPFGVMLLVVHDQPFAIEAWGSLYEQCQRIPMGSDVLLETRFGERHKDGVTWMNLVATSVTTDASGRCDAVMTEINPDDEIIVIDESDFRS
jgi:hypothetical protein